MKEHLDSYKKLGVVKILVHRVWDCKNVPAEGFESWFRAWFIKKHPNTFHKNDRFFNVKFDYNEVDNIFNQYVGLAV